MSKFVPWNKGLTKANDARVAFWHRNSAEYDENRISALEKAGWKMFVIREGDDYVAFDDVEGANGERNI